MANEAWWQDILRSKGELQHLPRHFRPPGQQLFELAVFGRDDHPPAVPRVQGEALGLPGWRALFGLVSSGPVGISVLVRMTLPLGRTACVGQQA